MNIYSDSGPQLCEFALNLSRKVVTLAYAVIHYESVLRTFVGGLLTFEVNHGHARSTYRSIWVQLLE
jgi:hypothetical protein